MAEVQDQINLQFWQPRRTTSVIQRAIEHQSLFGGIERTPADRTWPIFRIQHREDGERPTKEQAGQITGHIIEVATQLFLESSFEAVSVDLIAAKARISKQTFYARFESKEALFGAVIRKGVNDLLMPAVAESGRDSPIEATLVGIGIELSKKALTPAGIALDRLIASEAHQFPQLALAYHENAIHARGLIADIFSNAMRDGQIRSTDARFLAEQFIYAVVDGPVRAMILSGKIAKSEKDLRERITRAVGLLLDGCRAPAARRS